VKAGTTGAAFAEAAKFEPLGGQVLHGRVRHGRRCRLRTARLALMKRLETTIPDAGRTFRRIVPNAEEATD
jgi:hypothetical protein